VASSEYTVTESREEIHVETIEQTRVVCACCEQIYDEGETVAIGVDLDEDGSAIDTRPLCRTCTKATLDYELPETAGGKVINQIRREEPLSNVKHVAGQALPTLISLGITGIVGYVGLSVMSEVQASMTADTQAAMENVQPINAFEIGSSVLSAVLIVAIMVSILWMLQARGRRL